MVEIDSAVWFLYNLGFGLIFGSWFYFAFHLWIKCDKQLVSKQKSVK